MPNPDRRRVNGHIPIHGHTGFLDGGLLAPSAVTVAIGGDTGGSTDVGGSFSGAASDVTVADVAGNFTGGTVEDVLAELAGDLAAQTLDGLADVDVSGGKGDGNALLWDTASSSWLPGPPGSTFSGDAGDVPADSTGYANSTGTDVQAILDDFDAAITAGGGGGGVGDKLYLYSICR